MNEFGLANSEAYSLLTLPRAGVGVIGGVDAFFPSLGGSQWGFSGASVAGSATISSVGIPSIQAWAGTLTAVTATGSALDSVVPGLDAATPVTTSNAVASGVRISANTMWLSTTAGSGVGKPRAMMLYSISTAPNSNARFFAGLRTNVSWSDSPISGTSLGVHFGFGCDTGSTRIYACGYDGVALMTAVDTGHDLSTSLVYQVRIWCQLDGTLRAQLMSTSTFASWSVISDISWRPPNAINAAIDVGIGFANGASAGGSAGVLRCYSVQILRV